MLKDTLLSQQKVVYQTLNNALTNKQLSHCYLFVGPKGTHKKETALLLAQSLVCENKGNGFGCEKCSSCRRIKENNYIDLVYIDGNAGTIKNEVVQDLQDQFEKTAVEQAGEKIFIIDGCENLTNKAANSLLKFIEEPYGSITGIFITTQPERVMKTIVSRCQMLNFKPLNKGEFEKSALSMNLDELNAHFVSSFISSVEEIESVSTSKPYNDALQFFCEFTSLYLQKDPTCVIYLQDKFAKVKAEAKTLNETLQYFLEMSLLFIEDFLAKYHCDDQTYMDLLNSAGKNSFNYTQYLKAIIETRDALNRHPNILLLVDQLLYKLMEVNL